MHQAVVIMRDRYNNEWVLPHQNGTSRLSNREYIELQRIGALQLWCIKSGLCLVRLDVLMRYTTKNKELTKGY